MIKSKFKRVTSLFLATLMCVTTFAGIGSTTAYAASGEKADVYMVDFPRDGDANYDGVWGHSNLTLKNGWHTGRSNFTNLKAIGSYSGNVAYCIEPGISLKVGQTMNKYDENYFNNLAANGVISGDEIRLFVGRILQYGYRGTISTSWRSQNEAAANSIAQAEVSASPTFFGWVFGFNGKVQILAPESVKEQYRQMIAQADEGMQQKENKEQEI